MKTNLFSVKHHYHRMGPGGWYCPCCAPSPGHQRRKAAQAHKRRIYRTLDRIDRAELESLTIR